VKINYKNVKNKSLMFSFLVVFGFTTVILAQESINAAGSDAIGSGGKVAYSIGQAVYTTNTGSSGSIAQGVQHAYGVFTVGTEETELEISLIAFPNPTTDNLTLHVGDFNDERLFFQLIDMQGKQLIYVQILAQQTEINMKSFSPATYFINVVNQENLSAERIGKIVKSFKIIKN
jgi:hypothetical protein